MLKFILGLLIACSGILLGVVAIKEGPADYRAATEAVDQIVEGETVTLEISVLGKRYPLTPGRFRWFAIGKLATAAVGSLVGLWAGWKLMTAPPRAERAGEARQARVGRGRRARR